MMKPPTPLVLIIDDESSIRDGCRQALEKSGYAVLDAGEGDEGIKIARDAKPDIALIDLKMPGISGMEIIEILSRDVPDTVLVMITGYATIVSAVEAIQKGTYDYLPKPFSPDQLRAVVRRAVEHRNLKIETRRLREEKERMEKSFITFVSHEMRSPLVVIRQYIEALKAVAGDRLDRDMTEIIERCGARIQSLETLVEHWLDISRIGEGSFVWKKEPLNLLQLIGRSTEEMAPICKEKGILAQDGSSGSTSGNPRGSGKSAPGLHQYHRKRNKIHPGERQNHPYGIERRLLCHGPHIRYGNGDSCGQAPLYFRTVLPGERKGRTPERFGPRTDLL